MVIAEPVSTKNLTVWPFIIAITEKDKFRFTIDTVILSGSNALMVSLGFRAASPRDSRFPDWRVS